MLDISNSGHQASVGAAAQKGMRPDVANAELHREGLTDYAECLVTLTPSNLDGIRAHCDEQVEFIDPFNHSRGIDNLVRVMQDMFERLDDIRFCINDMALNTDGGYLLWSYSAGSSLTGRFSVEGVSLIKLNEQGKVLRHQDIWDASVIMEKLPVIGKGVAMIRRRAGCAGQN